MKRLLLGLVAALLIAAPCYAASTTATFGDMNSSGTYRMSANTDGVITFASDTGIVWPYSTATTNATLTAAQSSTTLVSSGTVDYVKYQLPAATVGLKYKFIAGTAKYIEVKPSSGEIIHYSTAAASNKIRSAGAIADSVEVFCATAGEWEIGSMKGTWTVSVNP